MISGLQSHSSLQHVVSSRWGMQQHFVFLGDAGNASLADIAALLRRWTDASRLLHFVGQKGLKNGVRKFDRR